MGTKETQSLNSDTKAIAALLRASRKCGIELNKAVQILIEACESLKISGEDSYRQLIDAAQDPGVYENMVRSICTGKHAREKARFLAVLVSDQITDAKKKKENEKKLMEIFNDILVECLENERQECRDEGEALYETEEDALHILDGHVNSKKLPDGETVTYVEIPSASSEELKEDLKIAEHLKEIPQIASKYDDESDIRLIFTVDNTETGLIAARYLSGFISSDYYNGNGETDSESGEKDDEIGEYYLDDELEGRISVIKFQEACEIKRQEYINHRSGFINNSIVYQGETKPKRPWWMRNNSIPLIVTIDTNDCIYGAEETFEALCKTRSFLVIIYENKPDIEQQDGLLGFIKNYSVNDIIEDISFDLNFDTHIIKEPKLESEYYKKVFIDAVTEKSYKISNGR